MLATGPSQIAVANNGTPRGTKRGINVFHLSELISVSGRVKDGEMVTGQYELPVFSLTPDERLGLFRYCAPVFGVVTGRMNRISALKWSVASDKKQEDLIAESLKTYYSVYTEYKAGAEQGNITHVAICARMHKEISDYLPDVLPDLSNFQSSLMRWYRNLKFKKEDLASAIENWLWTPNAQDSFYDFIKMWVFDLMVNGCSAIYKEALGGTVENLYILPGGSVIPLKSPYIGGGSAFAQIMMGHDTQVYYNDEIAYSNYVPNSMRDYGIIPLDSLVNKIAETMLFDRLMAEQADGTRPPDKVVVFGDNSPFGDIQNEFAIPLDPDKQKKIETTINEARKDAIRTISGVGQPVVLDMTRENTMNVQMQRQDQIKKDVALVYNMTNMEINESGSDATSGRSTSDAQADIEQQKGILPIVRIIEYKFNKEVLPFKFGSGYSFKFQGAQDQAAQIREWAEKANSGLYSVNEIRTRDMGELPFADKQFDTPKGAQPPQPGADPMAMLGG